jgi:glycosyltransferase involved in cell wall biosynthesis
MQIRSMKIGIDITAIEHGRGPGKYVSEVLAALSRMDIKNDAFYLYSPYPVNGCYPENFVPRHIPMQKYRPWLNWTLPRNVLKDGIDVMFFPANDFWLWPHVPTVVSVLDVAPATMLRDYHRSWIDELQIKVQMRRLDRIARKIITISAFSSDSISSVANVSVGKICVIPCGVSDMYHSPSNNSPRGDFILYIGGFDRRKNLEHLLDAYTLLRGAGFVGKLIMAGHSRAGGAGMLYQDMPALLRARELTGKVDLIENPADETIVHLYQTARMFVFPSMYEGFGLPVLEAMACGCPVACSSAASLPEVGGDAVMYFNPGNADSIAKTIRTLYDDESLREQFAEKGLRRATLFSWRQTAKSIYEVVRSCTHPDVSEQ